MQSVVNAAAKILNISHAGSFQMIELVAKYVADKIAMSTTGCAYATFDISSENSG